MIATAFLRMVLYPTCHAPACRRMRRHALLKGPTGPTSGSTGPRTGAGQLVRCLHPDVYAPNQCFRSRGDAVTYCARWAVVPSMSWRYSWGRMSVEDSPGRHRDRAVRQPDVDR